MPLVTLWLVVEGAAAGSQETDTLDFKRDRRDRDRAQRPQRQ